MQYHFHLIRNILKLPYYFPSETPSAPKSGNQAGGCQGPSGLGPAHATERKGIKWTLLQPLHLLLSSRDCSWLSAGLLGPG